MLSRCCRGRHQLPLSMMKIRLEILVGVGEIVVELCDDFLGLGVMDDPAAAALLGTGVEGFNIVSGTPERVTFSFILPLSFYAVSFF